ncbi:MAG: 4Fe-4S binding protein [Chloroflexi bacterium]|nr:4Fe-4S binding protein [Chloroflexota bacterium]
MGISYIDVALCNGCGICVKHCPLDVIRVDKQRRKAIIKYLRDCQSCALCEEDCPEHAIYVTPWRERRLVAPW